MIRPGISIQSISASIFSDDAPRLFRAAAENYAFDKT
jgi:hypothetical protein